MFNQKGLVTVRRRPLAVAASLFALGAALAMLLWHLSGGKAGGHGARETGAPPRRVITIGPNVTETVFALGAGDVVLAVTDFCTYPPEARRKPRVGGLLNPNLERIVELGPDLVMMQSPMEKVIRLCERRGVRWLALGMNTLEAIRSGVVKAGEALGREAEAKDLVAGIDTELEAVKNSVAGRPRVRLFLCTGRSPGVLSRLGTIGPGGFLAEVVRIAGGENVFADARAAYPQVSKEALVRRAPEAIIECRPGARLDEAALAGLAAEWNVLSSVPAVRGGRVYVLTDDFLMIPGPRIVKTARRLAEVLHPWASPETGDE